MPSYLSGNVIREIRLHKRWRQCKMSRESEYADKTIKRIENHQEKPNAELLDSFIDSLEIPTGQLLYPYLENQMLDTYALYDEIAFVLGNGDLKMAEFLIEEMGSMPGFEEGINLQAVIRYKTQLAYIAKKDPLGIILDVKKGMEITFPEFDENRFEDYPLIFEEVELLHTMARAYERLGDIQQAVKLLTSIKNGLMKLLEDDRQREKKLVSILTTLTDFLIQTGNFQESLTVCESGIDMSLKWSKGKELPQFLYSKAYCLFKLGKHEHVYNLLAEAYFCYLLLHNQKQAEFVKKEAHKIFGISIETYGTEKLSFNLADSYLRFERGEVIKCDSLGDLIGKLRVKAGLSQKELCQGACNVPTMCKIENGKINTNVYTLEVFMQRLGRDINLYINTFLSKREFELKQIRDAISVLLSEDRGEEAEILLKEIKDEKEFKRGINIQFIKKAEARILLLKEGKCTERYLDMLYEALKISLPKFDESMIEHYHLSFYEITLINQIAIYFCEKGQRTRGIKMFERLKESMDKTYVDEIEKMRSYGSILYNYSKNLGLKEYYKEAMEIIEVGEALCVKHGRLTLLPGYAVNKACDLLELGKKEESLPYFAMAYYGSGAVRNIKDHEIIKKYVEDRFGVIFT